MKNILIAAIALSAISAPAFAETVTINAGVAAACTTGFPANTNIGTAGNPLAISTGVGALNVAVVNAIGGPLGSEVICNGTSAKITVGATNLVGVNAPPIDAPAAFTNIVNYTLDINKRGSGYVQLPANGNTVISATSGATPAVQTVGLVKSDFTLDVKGAALPTNASILVAGAYTSTITLTVAPAG